MDVRRGRRVVLGCVAVVAVLFAFAGPALAEDPVQICPHRIILNAQGSSDDVQAIVRLVLPSAQIDSFDVVLYLDGVEVALAESAFYCVVDDNLIIGFDREDLQSNPDVIALAGQEVVATVEGAVVVSADGILFTREFIGSDSVEILKPGRK